ncbi:hypothetical protein [Nocardia sp. NPDC004260]
MCCKRHDVCCRIGLLLPLAYHRLQYEKLVRYHRKYALDSFAPPPGTTGGRPV